jgi:hypothetical protein
MAELPKFYVGDKVKRRNNRHGTPGEVEGFSKEIDYPGIGPTRKVYWRVGMLEVWDWEFELEAW